MIDTNIQDKWVGEANNADTLAVLEDIRIKALGKKGEISLAMKSLGQLAPEERKEAGQQFNVIKQAVSNAIEKRKNTLEIETLNQRLATETIDISQPIYPQAKGSIHPISQTISEITTIFGHMGFTVAEGPEIEDDAHNFTALNIPTDHPARQMHDTFYMHGHSGEEGSLVLRTHTSPVQIRTMKNSTPPIRIIAPGRTFRCDSDATHTPMFHQVEGLVVDEKAKGNCNMSHLKGVLLEFTKTFFGVDDISLRLRPSYFPFTEPSAEVDIGCEKGKGQFKIGTGNDWLEVLGCGMVHPNVLENCGIDSKKYQGFAFGMGVERLAMLKYGMPDLRPFFDGDTRWLDHYGFGALDIPSLLRGTLGTGKES